MSKKSTKMTKIPFRKAKKVINKKKCMQEKGKKGRKNIFKTNEGHTTDTTNAATKPKPRAFI